ncbi:MAG: AI-2E family transporter [Novosphingobium sp.]
MPDQRIKANRAELILLTVLTGLLGWVMWPYAGALFWAVVLAILLDPLWLWIERTVRAPKWVKALLAILAVLLLVIVPLIGVAALLPGQIQTLLGNLPSISAKFQSGLAQMEQALPDWLALEVSKIGSSSDGPFQMSAILNRFAGWLSSLAASTISIFVMASVALYVLFFLFLDGRRMFAQIRAYLPFDPTVVDMLASRFAEIVRSTVGGVFAIAVAQGIVCGIILALLGVGPALIFAILTTIVSLIPAIGSGLVWVPIAIYLLTQGEVTKAVILLLSGIFIISMVDNLLRPRLVGRGTRIPDFLILVTTLGGLSLMGAAGIVIGPMIAGLCLSMWQGIFSKPEIALEQPGKGPENG